MKKKYGLKTIDCSGMSYNGYRWDLSEGAVNTAPDWSTDSHCGGGLHFALNGNGDGSLFRWDSNVIWVVAELQGQIINLCGKVKCKSCKIVYAGNREDATNKIKILTGSHSVIGSTNTGGDVSTNSGGDWSTNTGGDRSTNTGGDVSTNSGGYRSTNTGGNWSTNTGGDWSTNTGGYGSTNTGGNWSTNSGGDRSTNSGGYRSTNTGGDRSINTGGDVSTNTGGDRSTNTGGDWSTFKAGSWGRCHCYGAQCYWIVEEGTIFTMSWYDNERPKFAGLIGKKKYHGKKVKIIKGEIVGGINGI